MQTTLLTIAIAFILALLAALVGPHFVDWNKYRAEFQASASRMTGLQVRLSGPIEARLLPTPSLTLQRIDIVQPTGAGAVRARKLNIEFSLGALVRGEWKATDVRIEGAELALSIDRNGRLDWPAPAIGFDPETISIERLDIRDSRALLAHVASGSGMVLDKFEFSGELRTLAGPLKGQGSFYLDGQHYPYRVAAGPAGDNGGVRLRLHVDPIDLPLTAEADGVISTDDGVPRFEGTMQLARPVVRAPKGSRKEILEPWRLSGRIRGDSNRAVIEQVEFQYGPDERPLKLRGDARMTFGRSPLLQGVLSSPQVDLDRILSLPEPERQRPAIAIKTFADYLAGVRRLPIRVQMGVSIESLTLAGAVLQRVSGDIKSEADGWDIETLEFRAPGLSQARVSGRLSTGAAGLSFAGRTILQARDPRALMAWLSGRTESRAAVATTLRFEGDLKLAPGAVAVERLRAELDHMTLQGRIAYSWGNSERPPRIEAMLGAPEIDLDRAYGLVQGLFSGGAFDWPREGELSGKIGRATFAGITARDADVNLRFNAHRIAIERLAVGDLGGAALAIKGRVDTSAKSPGGSLNLALDARSLDGLAAVLEKISPESASTLRRNAERLAPAKLNASLTVREANAPDRAIGSFKIAGKAGTFELGFEGDLGAGRDDLTLTNLARLSAARLNLGGRIEAGEGGTLVALLGLDQILAVTRGRGRMTFTARGPLDGDMMLDGQLLAGGLDVAAKGNVRLAGSQGPTAGVDITVASARVIAPRPRARPQQIMPVALTTRLLLAEGVIRLTDIKGKLAGSDISGRLNLDFGQPLVVDGDVALGAVSMPAALATAIGMPPSTGTAWPAEPFEHGLFGSLEGVVAVRFGDVVLTPSLAARDVRAVLRFERDELAIEKIDGSFAGGRIAGGLIFQRHADGVAMRSHLRLAGAQASQLLPGGNPSAVSGRVTLDLDLSGTGRSPTALIGALKGRGTFTLADARIVGLDPNAFGVVMRSVEQGLPIDARRVGGRMEAALRAGTLNVPLAEGELSAAAGQLRVANAAVQAHGADVAVAASVVLAEGVIRARLILTGPASANAPGGTRPEVAITLRGPVTSPERSIDASAFANWLALRAIEEKSRQLEALEKAKRAEALKPGGGAQIAPAVPYISGVPFATTAMPGQPAGAIGAWWEPLIGP